MPGTTLHLDEAFNAREMSRRARYLLAVAVTLVAAAIRWSIDPIAGDTSPFIVFYFAVAAAATLGGHGPGCLSLVLGTMIGVYFVIPPRYSFAIARPDDVVLLFLYLGTGGLMSLLGGWAHNARRRLRISEHRHQMLREAQAALRQSENRFREAFEHAPIGMALSGLDGRYLYVNSAYCSIAGYSESELLGPGFDYRRITHPDDLPQNQAAMAQLIAGQIPVFFIEKRYIRKDGSIVWVRVSSTVRRDTHGKPIQVVGLVEDITARKHAEAALEKAKANAEDANRAKDHFLAVLSHELRTPLTPVLAAVSLLQEDDKLDPETRNSLQMIQRNVELEARLIDDLLDLTRIVRGKVELDRHPVELATIVQRAVEVCRGDIEARELKFGIELCLDDATFVDADAARLQQVLWNLLKNAIKFTPHGGQVQVRCYRNGQDTVAIEIVDSGIGIEPEVLARIFNPFEQGEAAVTRQFGGLGLGLAISKALVDRHGGTIQATSEGRGRGATFTVTLPTVAPRPQRPHPPATSAGDPGAASHNGKLRILLVEDHGDTARVMRRLLMSGGHTVHTAGDVAAALQLVGAQPFDLLISDLGLPDGSGIDLMLALRARGLTIPGIALSGYGRDEDLQRSREAGFAIHLIKPINMQQLHSAIATVQEKPAVV